MGCIEKTGQLLENLRNRSLCFFGLGVCFFIENREFLLDRNLLQSCGREVGSRCSGD